MSKTTHSQKKIHINDVYDEPKNEYRIHEHDASCTTFRDYLLKNLAMNDTAVDLRGQMTQQYKFRRQNEEAGLATDFNNRKVIEMHREKVERASFTRKNAAHLPGRLMEQGGSTLQLSSAKIFSDY